MKGNVIRHNFDERRKLLEEHGSLQNEKAVGIPRDGFMRDIVSPYRGYRSRRSNLMRQRHRINNQQKLDDKRQVGASPKQDVSKRYGKWREKLKDKPELSSLLHKEGVYGLATFGYEPYQTQLVGVNGKKHDDVRRTGFACDETVICAS